MNPLLEHSAGVIPFRIEADGSLSFLILHSATVRNPRARWEFPKGGMEPGETPLQTAAREFLEETNLCEWSFREGFERNLTYTYVRRGRKVLKNVMYYVAEVYDSSTITRSFEHVEDVNGNWYRWGTFSETMTLLYHAKIRQLFAEADLWIRDQILPITATVAPR